LNGFLTGRRGLLQKYAYKCYADCDFDEQIIALKSPERLKYLAEIAPQNFSLELLRATIYGQLL
jgi:hypothetical protein